MPNAHGFDFGLVFVPGQSLSTIDMFVYCTAVYSVHAGLVGQEGHSDWDVCHVITMLIPKDGRRIVIKF